MFDDGAINDARVVGADEGSKLFLAGHSELIHRMMKPVVHIRGSILEAMSFRCPSKACAATPYMPDLMPNSRTVSHLSYENLRT